MGELPRRTRNTPPPTSLKTRRFTRRPPGLILDSMIAGSFG
jgi:hypothetical protein